MALWGQVLARHLPAAHVHKAGLVGPAGPVVLVLDREFDGRRALADRLPVEMFDSPLRGVQSADWQTRFPRSEAVRIFDAIRGDPSVSELLDLKRIKSCIDRWPTTDAGVLDGWELYGRMLPIALATGVFIKIFQSGVTELSACPT